MRGLVVIALMRAALFLNVLNVLNGCRPSVEKPDAALASIFSGAGAEWVDMSYGYDESTLFWPTAKPFQLEVVSASLTPSGYYYAANNFSMAEHGGTHLDAPIHFAEGRQTADRIPLERLIGAAVVVDVAGKAAADADYQVSVGDLQAWEKDHGRVPDEAILLLRTGWGARWPDRARYLGTSATGPDSVSQLHFPGLHPDAARWIVANRKVDAVGIDTPSLDYGQSTLFESHRALYAENIPGLENVAALDRLPPTGAFIIALPMKITGGSGGPVRIAGVIPRASQSRP